MTLRKIALGIGIAITVVVIVFLLYRGSVGGLFSVVPVTKNDIASIVLSVYGNSFPRKMLKHMGGFDIGIELGVLYNISLSTLPKITARKNITLLFDTGHIAEPGDTYQFYVVKPQGIESVVLDGLHSLILIGGNDHWNCTPATYISYPNGSLVYIPPKCKYNYVEDYSNITLIIKAKLKVISSKCEEWIITINDTWSRTVTLCGNEHKIIQVGPIKVDAYIDTSGTACIAIAYRGKVQQMKNTYITFKIT